MLIADTIARRIDEGAGHVTDIAPYMLNKLWGINYFMVTGPTSDAANYMDFLNRQGYGSVTAQGFIALTTASALLSGGFLSLARGANDFCFEGRSTVRPLELRIGQVSVFWPELTPWLNPDNVSLLIMVDAVWGKILFMRVGLDSPVLGNTSGNPELTCGVRVKVQSLSLGLEVTTRFVGLPFFIAGTELDLGDVFSLGLDGYYGAGNTMRESREYPLGPGAIGFIRAKL